LRGANEHIHINDTDDGVGDAVLFGIPIDRHQIRSESDEKTDGVDRRQKDQMRLMVLIVLGILLSHCAVPFAQGVTARDVISSINTMNNLHKYSEPAAREELITETKNILRDIQSQGRTQR
jgi:hypothetical protein